MKEWLHIPGDKAHKCLDCGSVHNCSSHCPACASVSNFTLATVLDRKQPQRVGVERRVQERRQA